MNEWVAGWLAGWLGGWRTYQAIHDGLIERELSLGKLIQANERRERDEEVDAIKGTSQCIGFGPILERVVRKATDRQRLHECGEVGEG